MKERPHFKDLFLCKTIPNFIFNGTQFRTLFQNCILLYISCTHHINKSTLTVIRMVNCFFKAHHQISVLYEDIHDKLNTNEASKMIISAD